MSQLWVLLMIPGAIAAKPGSATRPLPGVVAEAADILNSKTVVADNR